MWPCWIRLIYDYFDFCSDFCSHELNNWNNFWVMPLFLTKRLWNIHNLSRIQKGWFHQGWGGGGVHNPNFARYVPRQSNKMGKSSGRAPGRAWNRGSPEQGWAVLSMNLRRAPERASAVLSVKMLVSGTARTASSWRSGRLLTAAALPNALRSDWN